MAYSPSAAPERVYVKVTSDFDATGAVTPRSITWRDGRVFRIDAVRDFRPASAVFGAGHPGDCYTVMIQGEKKYLFFQRAGQHEGCCLGRWWVERIP